MQQVVEGMWMVEMLVVPSTILAPHIRVLINREWE